jgi:hypothetical protein
MGTNGEFVITPRMVSIEKCTVRQISHIPPFPLRNKFLKKTVNPDSQKAHAKKVEGIREIKQWASHDIQMAAMSACWPGCFCFRTVSKVHLSRAKEVRTQGTYSGHLDPERTEDEHTRTNATKA